MQVKWLRTALNNLDDEAGYIAQESPQAGAGVFAHVKAKVENLGEFPATGRPGRVPGTRELVIDRYPLLVPYRVLNDEVHVLRVFYTRRMLPI